MGPYLWCEAYTQHMNKQIMLRRTQRYRTTDDTKKCWSGTDSQTSDNLVTFFTIIHSQLWSTSQMQSGYLECWIFMKNVSIIFSIDLSVFCRIFHKAGHWQEWRHQQMVFVDLLVLTSQSSCKAANQKSDGFHSNADTSHLQPPTDMPFRLMLRLMFQTLLVTIIGRYLW